ncbi:MAG: ankyrin repeat domain-containing protein [Pseudomonadota bacterium]
MTKWGWLVETKEIDIESFLQDVRDGAHHMTLMRKYMLSPSQLKTLMAELPRSGQAPDLRALGRGAADKPDKSKAAHCPNCGESGKLGYGERPSCEFVASRGVGGHAGRTISSVIPLGLMERLHSVGKNHLKLIVCLGIVLGIVAVGASRYASKEVEKASSSADADGSGTSLDKRLLEASAKGNVSAVDELIHAGARVNILGPVGVTPLIWASSEGHAEVVRLLLEAGSNIETVSKHGMTALMVASRNGHEDVVKILIQYGAKVYMENPSRGQTALTYAREAGHEKVRKILEEHSPWLKAE